MNRSALQGLLKIAAVRQELALAELSRLRMQAAELDRVYDKTRDDLVKARRTAMGSPLATSAIGRFEDWTATRLCDLAEQRARLEEPLARQTRIAQRDLGRHSALEKLAKR